MDDKVITLEERDMPHVATIFHIANEIAWAGAENGLASQVNVHHDTLTDLRCALTAIDLGRK